jgi:glycogen operon protein
VAEFSRRFTGSSDLYGDDGRTPVASINFVTAHDGFTLADLVSYNSKHNEANQEDNRDGADDNRSWTCGAEGPTDDPNINTLRGRQQRNFLTTLLLSQGVPMLLGGDEFGRSQKGNNNAWCQDNELSWFDWDAVDEQLLDFARALIRIRRTEPVFRRSEFLTGETERGSGLPDVLWLRPDGEEMTEADWERDDAHALALFLNGEEIPTHDRWGDPIEGASFLLMFNAHHEPIRFVIPEVLGDDHIVEVDTADQHPRGKQHGPGEEVPVESRSILVMRRASRMDEVPPEPAES